MTVALAALATDLASPDLKRSLDRERTLAARLGKGAAEDVLLRLARDLCCGPRHSWRRTCNRLTETRTAEPSAGSSHVKHGGVWEAARAVLSIAAYVSRRAM